MGTVLLSAFIEFSVASGTPRVGWVAAAKQDYDPRRDFYKELRERTVKQFEDGWNAREFRHSLQSITDPKKFRNYNEYRVGLTPLGP